MDHARLRRIRELVNHRVDYEDWPEENGWHCVLCADIVVYFEGFSEALKPNGRGMLDFYEQSMALVRDEIKWVLVDGAGKFRKITKKAFDLIPYWLSPEGPDRGIRGVDMQGGPEQNGRTDKSFSFYRSTRSHLRLTLPVEYMLEDPLRFAELAKSMLGRLKFVTGNAGFSVNMHPDGVGADSEEGGHVYMLSRRFDGLDIGVPWDSSYYAKHGLRTINWLTFVGDGMAQRMNGRDGVKAALPADIPVTDLEYGLMIQAGPRPVLGDVNWQESVEEYYRVGRALKPVALQLPAILDPETHRTEGYGRKIGGEDNTERWCKRFFQDRAG